MPSDRDAAKHTTPGRPPANEKEKHIEYTQIAHRLKRPPTLETGWKVDDQPYYSLKDAVPETGSVSNTAIMVTEAHCAGLSEKH